MRDIRSDLQERLDAVEKDRAAMQQRMTELEQAEAGLRVLLQRESQNTALYASDNGGADIGGTELARLILQTLHQAKKPLILEDFKKAAEAVGFDFGDKSPGRVLHWALVGMATGNSVEKVGDKWQIKEES